MGLGSVCLNFACVVSSPAAMVPMNIAMAAGGHGRMPRRRRAGPWLCVAMSGHPRDWAGLVWKRREMVPVREWGVPA